MVWSPLRGPEMIDGGKKRLRIKTKLSVCTINYSMLSVIYEAFRVHLERSVLIGPVEEVKAFLEVRSDL